MTAREREIEASLKANIEAEGGLFLKWVSPGNDGVPDRILIYNGRVIFVELKTKPGKLSPIQVHQQERLRKAGATVVTTYGFAGSERLRVDLLDGREDLPKEYRGWVTETK